MNIKDFVLNSEGKFITVTFIKNDFTIRKINGRLGVKKYLKGFASNLNPKEYITIYSLKDKGYRAININTILKVNCNGLTIERA